MKSGSVRTVGTSARSMGGNTDADTCLGYCQQRKRIPASAGQTGIAKIDWEAGLMPRFYFLESFFNQRYTKAKKKLIQNRSQTTSPMASLLCCPFPIMIRKEEKAYHEDDVQCRKPMLSGGIIDGH